MTISIVLAITGVIGGGGGPTVSGLFPSKDEGTLKQWLHKVYPQRLARKAAGQVLVLYCHCLSPFQMVPVE